MKNDIKLGSFVRLTRSSGPSYLPAGTRGKVEIIDSAQEYLVRFEKHGDAWICAEDLEPVKSTTIYIFFGEMGAGKSYLGRKFAEQMGANFYEGDDSLPPSLREKVSKGQPLTSEDIDLFMHYLISDLHLKASRSLDRPLIVSQALYKNEHRLAVQASLRTAGHDVIFYHVQANAWQNLKQLWARPKKFRWIANWLMSKPFFETPSHYCVDLKIYDS